MSTTPQPTSQPPIHIQQFTSTNAIPGATSTLVEAFESDPVTAYILNHLPPSARLPALQNLFLLTSHAALLAGCSFWSASASAPENDTPAFQAAATIFPPGASLDNLGATSIPSLLLGGGLAPALWSIGPARFMARMNAFTSATTPAKKATFPHGERFFYVMFVGAKTLWRGKGLGPALIRELQARATREGVPVYLEASNQPARKVYLKLGFEDVHSVIYLGKGECDAEGEVASGDEAVGVPVWPMVWRPEGYDKAKA